MIVEIFDDEFKDEVLDFEGMIIVDFYSPECAPCKALLPVLEEVNENVCPVVKINVLESPETASEYRIKAIPTLKLFKDGKPFKTLYGKDANLKTIKEWLGE